MTSAARVRHAEAFAGRPAGGAAQIAHHGEHDRPQLARPLGVGPQPLGDPLGLLVVELRSSGGTLEERYLELVASAGAVDADGRAEEER